MGRSVGMVVGAVVALMGAFFFLQGIGVVVSASPMTNTTTWSVLGPLIALVGVVVLVLSARRPRPRR